MSFEKSIKSLQVPMVKLSIVEEAMTLIEGHTDLNTPGPIDAWGEFRELTREYVASLTKEIGWMKDLIAKYENVISSADAMILDQMRFHHMDDIQGVHYSFKRNGCVKRVIIEDESKIPAKFQVVKTTTIVDKVAIRQAIEGGENVPGATLDGGEYLAPKCTNE